MSKDDQPMASEEAKVFRTTFRPTDHEKFEVVCCPGGTGHFSDGSEQVDFSFEPALYQDPDALKECLDEIFWEEINPALNDPVIRWEDLEGEELHYETGSEEQLKEEIRMILWCFPELFAASSPVDVRIQAATGEDGCGWESDDGRHYPEVINDLMNLALERSCPVGGSWEYNDGPYNRLSGYTLSSESVTCIIPRPSFHDVALARPKLLRFVQENTTGSKGSEILAKLRQAWRPNGGEGVEK
jgi:hypothetical protein